MPFDMHCLLWALKQTLIIEQDIIVLIKWPVRPCVTKNKFFLQYSRNAVTFNSYIHIQDIKISLAVFDLRLHPRQSKWSRSTPVALSQINTIISGRQVKYLSHWFGLNQNQIFSCFRHQVQGCGHKANLIYHRLFLKHI